MTIYKKKIIPVVGMMLQNNSGTKYKISRIDDKFVHYTDGGFDDKNTLEYYYKVVYNPRKEKTIPKNTKTFIVTNGNNSAWTLEFGTSIEEVLLAFPEGQYEIQEYKPKKYKVYVEAMPKKVQLLKE